MDEKDGHSTRKRTDGGYDSGPPLLLINVTAAFRCIGHCLDRPSQIFVRRQHLCTVIHTGKSLLTSCRQRNSIVASPSIDDCVSPFFNSEFAMFTALFWCSTAASSYPGCIRFRCVADNPSSAFRIAGCCRAMGTNSSVKELISSGTTERDLDTTQM